MRRHPWVDCISCRKGGADFGWEVGERLEQRWREMDRQEDSPRPNFLFLLWTFGINACLPRVALCDRACRLAVRSGLVMLWCASARVPCLSIIIPPHHGSHLTRHPSFGGHLGCFHCGATMNSH